MRKHAERKGLCQKHQGRRVQAAAALGGLMASVLAGCGLGEGDMAARYPNGEVKVYNWGEYIDEELIDQFQEEYGIRVIYDTFTTNEEMFPKLQAEPGMYDVVCPSDYMIEKMIQYDMVQPLDKDKLPHYDNIGTAYLEKMEEFDPGNQYALPYTWGTVGILYNTSMVQEPVDSWDILWDETYENEIIMQDSVRDAFMVALKRLGYSCNTTDEGQLEEAMVTLRDQKRLVKAYAIDEVRDKMIDEAAALGVIYSGEYLYCKEENPQLAYAVPQEGSNIWFDGWVITSGAQNMENAHKWLDFLCTAEAAYKNFEYITYATPNTAAQEMIAAEYLEDPGVFADEETIGRCEVYRYLGDEMDNIYYEFWKKVK